MSDNVMRAYILEQGDGTGSRVCFGHSAGEAAVNLYEGEGHLTRIGIADERCAVVEDFDAWCRRRIRMLYDAPVTVRDIEPWEFWAASGDPLRSYAASALGKRLLFDGLALCPACGGSLGTPLPPEEEYMPDGSFVHRERYTCDSCGQEMLASQEYLPVGRRTIELAEDGGSFKLERRP